MIVHVNELTTFLFYVHDFSVTTEYAIETVKRNWIRKGTRVSVCSGRRKEIVFSINKAQTKLKHAAIHEAKLQQMSPIFFPSVCFHYVSTLSSFPPWSY